MSSSLQLTFIFILINIHQSSSQPSPNHKNVQLIGHTRYVSLREEAQRNFCGNFWCANDAFYLFTKSSQYVGVDPCDDFKNFTVNHVEEVDHPDDRLLYRGFQGIVLDKYSERLRKVVAAKIDPIKDSRVVKVMKNSFHKCLKSPHLTRHLQAHKDIIKHLQSLGGSPYLSKHTSFNLNLFDDNAVEYFYNKNYTLNINENVSDDLWNETNFNLKKIFETEPEHALSLFLNLELKRCDDNGKEIFCLTQPDSKWDYIANGELELIISKEFFNDLEDSYRHPKVYKNFLIDQLYKPTVNRKREYVKKRDEIEKSFGKKLRLLLPDGRIAEIFVFNQPKKIKIKDLQEKLSDFDIDWLKIINSQLFNHSKVTENEEILMRNAGIEMLQELVRNLVKTDKKVLADTFVSSFLYANRYSLILRFHNQQDLINDGTKHGNQRWRRCIVQYHHSYMYPAHIFMYEQRRNIWDRTAGDFRRDFVDERDDIVGNAEKFVQEAVDEFKLRFKTGTTMKTSVAIEVLNKLKNLKIIISLQSKIFTAENLEEFYNELQLNGDEEFLDSVWKMEKFHRKILNEPLGSWRKQIDRMVNAQSNEWITYNIEDGNILFIPAALIIYPFYHPLRPRFFNMATIFREIIYRINEGIERYVRKKFNLQPWTDYEIGIDDNIQCSYEHYSNWLKNHTDLVLGANLLTHRQLYWVSVAVVNYARYHKTVPKSFQPKIHLNQEYYHVHFKRLKGFQEAFHCNITAEELAQFQEYKNKLDRIL